MTPAGELLRQEIVARGPIPFSRFMEVALYHPEYGYYRRAPVDPFGKHGDFFTAEQLQPTFGILMAAFIDRLREELDDAGDFTVVQPGAGRGEMGPAFARFRYVPVDIDRGELPAHFTGVVFANEFFDALPVDSAVFHGGVFLEHLVGMDRDRFAWRTGAPVGERAEDYLHRFFPEPQDEALYEVNLAALDWMDRIAHALQRGFVLVIDYGYRRAEWLRFPAGSLMSYRRHRAIDDVLANPGEQDITAHVNFDALIHRAEERGLPLVRFESLAQLILRAGEPDQFAKVIEHRMQLKTLLFGMGETFRVALFARPGGFDRSGA